MFKKYKKIIYCRKNISSSDELLGMLDVTHTAFPCWIACDILWYKYCFVLGSPVILIRLDPILFIRLTASFDHGPNDSTAKATKWWFTFIFETLSVFEPCSIMLMTSRPEPKNDPFPRQCAWCRRDVCCRRLEKARLALTLS